MSWPQSERVVSARLYLDPLSVEHAREMREVLSNPSIYEYTGGEPPSLEQLSLRYAAQSVGHSEDGTQGWFNWIVRLRASDDPIGFVQATVEHNGTESVADIAWVISPVHQGQGLASEATSAMTGWLRSTGVNGFAAFVHPDHRASISVAKKQGLHPTSLIEDGEVRWESGQTADAR